MKNRSSRVCRVTNLVCIIDGEVKEYVHENADEYIVQNVSSYERLRENVK